MPPESAVIYTAQDGFPDSATIQKRVEGQTLKNFFDDGNKLTQ